MLRLEPTDLLSKFLHKHAGYNISKIPGTEGIMMSDIGGSRVESPPRPLKHACADPESFIRWVLVDEGSEDPNTTKGGGPSSAHQRDAIWASETPFK